VQTEAPARGERPDGHRARRHLTNHLGRGGSGLADPPCATTREPSKNRSVTVCEPNPFDHLLADRREVCCSPTCQAGRLDHLITEHAPMVSSAATGSFFGHAVVLR
jgi:hypothetical protein